MGTLANSEDSDEMQHNAAFHQGLHCLLRLKRSSEKKKSILVGNHNLCPLNTMKHPKFTVSYQMEEPIRIQWV